MDAILVPEKPWYAPERLLPRMTKIRRLPWVPIILILALLVVPAAFADQIAPYGTKEGGLPKRYLPPVWDGGTSEHILGTDRLGRDILSRIIHGARVSP